MLNKRNRIKNKADIKKLFKSATTYKDSFFIIKYTNINSDFSMFSVSVGKKIYKKAVNRNHLRRQIYEAIRINMHKSKNNIQAFLIANIQTKNASFKDLENSINNFLLKLKN